MTVNSSTASYRPPPDAARIQKDNGEIARAQRTRDNTQEQKAAAELRRDTAAQRADRSDRAERADSRAQAAEARREAPRREDKVGTALDVKA